jgi:hypothetical protein
MAAGEVHKMILHKKLPQSTGDRKLDTVIENSINLAVPIRPIDNEMRTGKLAGQLDAMIVTVVFNVAADTEVVVANPWKKIPESFWLFGPLDMSGLVTPGSTAVAGAQPMQVRAYLGSAQNLRYNTWTKILLDTASFDADSEFDATNNRITAKKAVMARFAGRFEVDTTTGDQAGGLKIALYKGGAVYGYGNFMQKRVGTGASAVQFAEMNGPVVSDLIELAVGEYVELWGYQNYFNSGGGGNIPLVTGSENTYLSGSYEQVQAIPAVPTDTPVIYKDSTTAWSVSQLGFKCSRDTSTDPLTVKILIA